MELSKRQLYFLYQCFLRSAFAIYVKEERPLNISEIDALAKEHLIADCGAGWYCTEGGLAELSIAGIDTRNARKAVSSWKRKYNTKKKETPEGTDSPVYNRGRAEGQADMCAELRTILDPNDVHHWNKEG